MVSFFKKIRLQLAYDNKPIKYMRYAVGEIVLIVVGILLALQINIWNQDRQNRQKESHYLIDLSRDLTEQLEWMKVQIEFEEAMSNNSQSLLDSYVEKGVFVVDESFVKLASPLIARKTFVSITTTYVSMISSGEIDLIRNLELRNSIIRYFESLLQSAEIIKQNNQMVDNLVTPFLCQNVFMEKMQVVEQNHGFTVGSLVDSNQKSMAISNLLNTASGILSDSETALNFHNVLLVRYTVSNLHQKVLKEDILEKTRHLLAQIQAYQTSSG